MSLYDKPITMPPSGVNVAAFEALIKANEEAPPERPFNMRVFAHPCGTPACLLGNYAERHDLQGAFWIGKHKGGGQAWLFPFDSDWAIGVESSAVLEHFGITASDAVELFGEEGCDGATTRDEAIEYVRGWLEQRIEDEASAHDEAEYERDLPEEEP